MKNINCHISIKITTFEVRINTGLNHEIFNSRMQYPKCPIYSTYDAFELRGVCNYPEERQDSAYIISVYGKESTGDDFDATLDNYPVLGKHNEPKYKKRGNHSVPLYDPPQSIGFMDTGRKDKPWHACVWVPPVTANSMLTLLTSNLDIYVSLHEVKTGRKRHIRYITLQTTDPSLD